MRAACLCVLALLAGCAGPDTPPSTTAPTTGSTLSPSATTPAPSTGFTTGADPIRLFFDFGGETEGSGDLSGWTAKSDVPSDPNNPGNEVAWNVTACPDAGYEDHVHIVAHPVHSACFTLDGRQGNGTVWISREIPVQRGVSYDVAVTVRAWESQSANQVADIVLRIGSDGAADEADFATGHGLLHGAHRMPLDRTDGWGVHGLRWSAPSYPDSVMVLDVGISAVWETQMTRYLDAVAVEITPR